MGPCQGGSESKMIPSPNLPSPNTTDRVPGKTEPEAAGPNQVHNVRVRHPLGDGEVGRANTPRPSEVKGDSYWVIWGRSLNLCGPWCLCPIEPMGKPPFLGSL